MENTRVGLFLQARIESQRLFKKAILPLKGGLVIEHVMRALRNIKADVYALLTTETSAGFLSPYAHNLDFEVFIGSSWDVLSRFERAAGHFNVNRIIRATGDNPLVSAFLGNRILEIHAFEKADLSHFIGPPLGTGIEVIEMEALGTAAGEAVDPFEREHITSFLYRNRERFKIIERLCGDDYYLPDIKISLDTLDDYRLISRIFTDLYKGKPIEADELVGWIKEEKIGNPDFTFPGSGLRPRNRPFKAVSAS